MQRKIIKETNNIDLKRKMLRILSAFVVIVAILVFSPITARAAGRRTPTPTTGNCGAKGDNVTYSYDEEKQILTISGSGKMKDYDYDDLSPFCNLGSLAHVEIESGVESVGAYAFYSCYNLEDVRIADTVTSVGEHAFYFCQKLSKVELTDYVTSIGVGAFMDCKSLKNLNLPKKLKKIDRNTFYNCEYLTSIDIPDSVTSIGVEAFLNTGLISVKIPDKVTIIEQDVFMDCENLTNVTINGDVTSIGNQAFQNCNRLEYLLIPDSVTSIGESAFKNSGLTSVTIPGSVKSIGTDAFLDCSGLKNVSIPNSVNSIGDYAFGFNYSDSKYELIPDFVISCNQGSAAEAYVKKHGVKFEITLSSLPPTGTDFTYNGSVLTGVPQEEYYTITDNTGVNAGAYTAAITLKEGYRWPDGTSSKKMVEWTIKPASISSAAVEIADQTYTGKPLAPQPTVKIADKTLIKNTDYTVSYSDNTNVGEATVTITGSGNYNGTKMANFTIAEGKTPSSEDPTPTPNPTPTPDPTQTPGTQTQNPGETPRNQGTTDSSATEVKTGDTVNDDNTNASYVITSTETNNETVAYVSTTNNTASTLTVPDTVMVSGKNYKVTEIKANAFKNNKKLKKVTIGKNIERIGKNAFSGCKNLKNVNIKTVKLTKKTVGANAFKGIHDKAKVKVPKSKLKDYKTILKARGIKGKNRKITK